MLNSELGFHREADHLLSKFKWGPNFYRLNKRLIQMYQKCSDAASVSQAQQQFLEREERDREEQRRQEEREEEECGGDLLRPNLNRSVMPSSSDSDDDSDSNDEETWTDDYNSTQNNSLYKKRPVYDASSSLPNYSDEESESENHTTEERDAEWIMDSLGNRIKRTLEI